MNLLTVVIWGVVRVVFVCWLLFFSCLLLYAQPSSSSPVDSIGQAPVFKPLQDIMPTTTTGTLTQKKDPVVALLLSAVPGLGQIYVGSYWKAPLALGGAAVCAYQIIRTHNLYKDYSRQYEQLDSATKDSAQGRRTLYIREFYRDARDTYGLFMMGVYLLSAIDAYVGAHLFEFDVTDDLKAAIGISPLQGRLNLVIRW